MHRVVLVAFDDVQALDLAGPLDVFDAAGRVRARDWKRNGTYQLEVAAPALDFRTSAGLRCRADRRLKEVRGPVDTLLIAGGRGARKLVAEPSFGRELRRLASASRRVASVCTGAFLLAAAGLLEGRRVTTHWAFCEALQRAVGGAAVHADAIFVRDGDLWTSAGVTAGMDLALALVEDDLGRAVALDVARYLVLFVRRPGGQSQFSAQLAAQQADRAPLRDLQTWVLEHVAEDLRVERLAARVGMSPRNFSRVFRREVGLSPAAYVERVRVEVARRLLEESALDLEGVAAASGLGAARTLRRAFQRQLGVAPKDYRARFRAPRERALQKKQGEPAWTS